MTSDDHNTKLHNLQRIIKVSSVISDLREDLYLQNNGVNNTLKQ